MKRCLVPNLSPLTRLRSLQNIKNRKRLGNRVMILSERPAATMIETMFKHVTEKTDSTVDKVTVVGTGQVGMACIISLLAQGVTSDVAMVDLSEARLKGEMLDLQHGTPFLRNAKIQSSKDYNISAGSRISIIAAGARQSKGETRLALLQRNADIFKKIIPELIKQSPDTIIIVATNPVDILTWVSWKLSGFPLNRVIGSGTNLDSARFRYLLSKRLKVAPTAIHGFVIGEHGDSSVPVWSSLNIAGVRFRDLNPKMGLPDDPEKWSEVHHKVVRGGYEVHALKGFTSWAIGLSLAEITRAILTNTQSVHAVSTHPKCEHGIKHDIFISLPCVLGSTGVVDILRQKLDEHELKMLKHSADVIQKAQSTLKL